jgi:hypothetical protein
MGSVAYASLKATTLLFLTHDVFVVYASMMPEPHRRGHMANLTPPFDDDSTTFFYDLMNVICTR